MQQVNPFGSDADQLSIDHCHHHYTATEIVSRIEKGEWTASQVIEAYIARASLAHAATNCLTEGVSPRFTSDIVTHTGAVMFDWAREQAHDLDAEFASTKKLRGPLHGVPVGKNNIHLYLELTSIFRPALRSNVSYPNPSGNGILTLT